MSLSHVDDGSLAEDFLRKMDPKSRREAPTDGREAASPLDDSLARLDEKYAELVMQVGK